MQGHHHSQEDCSNLQNLQGTLDPHGHRPAENPSAGIAVQHGWISANKLNKKLLILAYVNNTRNNTIMKPFSSLIFISANLI